MKILNPYVVLIALVVTSAIAVNWPPSEKPYEYGCAAGQELACYQLAHRYAKGHIPFPRSMARAEALMIETEAKALKSCEAAKVVGCMVLLMRANGNGTFPPPDLERQQLFVETVKNSARNGCTVGDLLLCSFLKDATEQELEILLKNGETNGVGLNTLEDEQADEMQNVSILLDEVMGTAMEGLFQSCDAGAARNCGLIGILRNRLNPLESHSIESFGLLGAGCAGGDDRACMVFEDVRLANLFNVASKSNAEKIAFIEIDRNINEALFDACGKGIAQACRNLAHSQDFQKEEHQLLMMGCKADHALSCRDLGYWYYQKVRFGGNHENLNIARETLEYACNLGDIYSCHLEENLPSL